MTVNVVTSSTSEAELNASIRELLGKAFPWMNPDDIKHETTFRVDLGVVLRTADGTNQKSADGRIDILLKRQGEPLAILELKRPGHHFTDRDRQQGISYARLIPGFAPLVILYAGAEPEIIDSYSGLPLQPQDKNEERLLELLKNIGTLALSKRQEAVRVLMGPDVGMWFDAVRRITKELISEIAEENITDDGKLIAFNRSACHNVIEFLKNGAKIVGISGVPLAGKTFALVNCCLSTQSSPDYAFLLLEGRPHGILRQLTTIIERHLRWNITVEEVRSWLRQIGDSESGPAFVIAVDGLHGSSEALIADLHEIADLLGPKLRLVIAEGDALLTELAGRNRQNSRLGRMMKRVEISLLDSREFENAANMLGRNFSLGVNPGARFAPEYRVPWVFAGVALRGANARIRRNAQGVALPPCLGVGVLLEAERLFGGDEILDLHERLAKCMLDHSLSASMKEEEMLKSCFLFRAPAAKVRRVLAHEEEKRCVSDGYIKLLRDNDKSYYVSCAPELIAAVISRLLVRDLVVRVTRDPSSAADWLVKQTCRLPMGDLIAARAIMLNGKKGFPWEFIARLISRAPVSEPLRDGTRIRLAGSEIELVVDGSNLILEWEGRTATMPLDVEDRPFIQSNSEPWLILSQLCSVEAVSDLEDGTIADARGALLLEIGSCSVPLVRCSDKPVGLELHDVEGASVVCHRNGLAEPITGAIADYLNRHLDAADAWLEVAIARKSPALLSRVSAALVELIDCPDPAGAWARQMLEQRISPALDSIIAC